MDKKENRVPKVVIAGAGFGGLRASQALANQAVDVTLVDRNNYHLFQPLLYQVATSALSADAIAHPVRSIVRRQPNVKFVLGDVTEIDLNQRAVRTLSGDLSYDYLIVGVGGETNYFNLSGVEKFGFGLKVLQDATAIRNHLMNLFEQAAKEPDPSKRRALLTFLIAGGGPTGVETAGAVSELVHSVLQKDFPEIAVSEARIILFEATGRLLGAMPRPLGQFAEMKLEKKHGVEVRFNTVLSGYDGEEAKLKDGSAIPACTLIWAAGVRASRLLDGLGLPQDRQGRVKVSETLQAPGFPEVFFIGDAAHVLDQKSDPLPMVAQVAMQQGRQAAKNILRAIECRPMAAFKYHDLGTLATIGRNQAVADLGRLRFTGFIAWIIWVVVHIYQLIGFRNRAVVMMDWAWNYFFHERAVRLIGPG